MMSAWVSRILFVASFGFALIVGGVACKSSSSSVASNAIPGTSGSSTGSDVQGVFRASVTAVGGAWATTHWVTNGAVLDVTLALAAIGELSVTSPAGTFTLTYNSATGKYEGDLTYADADPDSPFNGSNVTESWSVWQSGDQVLANVAVINDGDANTASLSAALYEPFNAASEWKDNFYFGTITASNKPVWTDGALGLWTSGSYAALARDNFYREDLFRSGAIALWRNGSTVGGGGEGETSVGEKLSVTATFTLNGVGQPISGSLSAYNHVDDATETASFTNLQGTTAVLGKIFHTFAAEDTYDYTITSMTAGGKLADIFPSYDPLMPATWVYTRGSGYGMLTGNYYLSMYFEDTTNWRDFIYQLPAWNGDTTVQFVDHDPDAGGDIPYTGGPENYCYKVRMTVDPLTGVFVSGTLDLYMVNGDGSLSDHEQMTFDFSPAP